MLSEHQLLALEFIKNDLDPFDCYVPELTGEMFNMHKKKALDQNKIYIYWNGAVYYIKSHNINLEKPLFRLK